MGSIDYKKIEDEFISLSHKYLFEEAKNSVITGQSVDKNSLAERIVNRVSDELMRKYSLTTSDMIKIVERAAPRMSLG